MRKGQRSVLDSDLILNIFSKLYDSQVKLCRTDTLKNSSEASTYYSIPGKDRIRWILPENPKLGMPVIKQWHPYDLSSQVKWKVILLVYKLGQLKNLPGIKTINVITPSCMIKNNTWAATKNSQYSPVVYIGTPGPDQKAVASIVDRETLNTHCIIKIPLGQNASKKIIHEAKMIKSLNKKKANLGPDNIFVDEKKGIAGQKAISGKLANREMTNHLIEWLAALNNNRTTTLGLHCDRLFEKLHKINVTEAIHIYNLMKKNILEKDLSLPLPSVWLHGDFAPWNLKHTQNGIQAIDWEDAKEDGLPLQDLIHFYYIQTYLFNEKKNLLTQNSAKPFIKNYCSSLKIPFTIIHKLELFYLANKWLKQHQANNSKQKQFLFASMQTIGAYH